jgi:hypothetical protein
MIHHHTWLVSQVSGAALASLFWGISFWRIVRTKSGNEALECGGIAIVVVLVMGFFPRVVGLPEWTLFCLMALIFLLCNVALFFFFTEGFRALGRRKTKRGRQDPHKIKNMQDI